ncbi:MAG: hypothetical protein PHC86_00015 [Eubacteriales bacterium]|nr:hypothetical protein [Eubacteriales bacterium]
MRSKGVALLLAFSFAWLLTLGFPLHWPWQAAASLIVASGMVQTLHSAQASQNARADQRRYRQLLAYLSARLSIGETIERALASSSTAIGPEIGPKSTFNRDLQQLGRQVHVRSDLTALLGELLEQHPAKSVRPLLLILPKMQQLGSRLDLLVRQAHRLLTELDAIEQEVRAEQSQKTAESLILMVLPFLLTPSLMQFVTPAERAALYASTLSQIVFTSLFLLAALALILVWISLTRQSDGQPHHGKKHVRKPSRHPAVYARVWWPSLSANMAELVAHVASWLDRQYLTFQDTPLLIWLTPSLPRAVPLRRIYFKQKIQWSALIVLFSAIWVGLGVIPIVVLIIALPTSFAIHDLTAVKQRQQLINNYRLSYPLLMNWLVQLLQSGFSVLTAIELSRDGWQAELTVQCDLDTFAHLLRSGHSIDDALEQLGEQSPVFELKAFWFNVARYQREGSLELLDLLAMQALGGYQLQRIGYRRLLETQSLLILLPMMLDLLVILGISLWPALFSLLA